MIEEVNEIFFEACQTNNRRLVEKILASGYELDFITVLKSCYEQHLRLLLWSEWQRRSLTWIPYRKSKESMMTDFK
jgi:hypothetical protein